jgi:hypothetical protein
LILDACRRRSQVPWLLAFVAAGAALADDAAIERALIERDQQTDRFGLELRQSQERLAVPPGDARARRELESRQLKERQDFDRLGERQLDAAGRPLSPDPATARELRPHAREKAARERRLQLSPPEGLKPRAEEPPRPLPGGPPAGVELVTPPPAQ